MGEINDIVADLQPASDPFADDPRDRVFRAILDQESSGGRNRPNPDSGALGIGQVMPSNVRAWSKKHIGRELSPDEFAANPKLQEQVVRGQVNEYFDQALKRSGGDVDRAVRMTGAMWYGGPDDVDSFDDDTPRHTNGREYPSFKKYTTSLLGHFREPRQVARPDTSKAFADYEPPTSNWSIDRLPEVEGFYKQTFGRALPITAHGQSSTHNRMNLDHRDSADVGVNPDSAEGKALREYLDSQGIPYLAFSHAVPGQATGPHIHIGYRSRRIGAERRAPGAGRAGSVSAIVADLVGGPDAGDELDEPQAPPKPALKPLFDPAGVPIERPVAPEVVVDPKLAAEAEKRRQFADARRRPQITPEWQRNIDAGDPFAASAAAPRGKVTKRQPIYSGDVTGVVDPNEAELIRNRRAVRTAHERGMPIESFSPGATQPFAYNPVAPVPDPAAERWQEAQTAEAADQALRESAMAGDERARAEYYRRHPELARGRSIQAAPVDERRMPQDPLAVAVGLEAKRPESYESRVAAAARPPATGWTPEEQLDVERRTNGYWEGRDPATLAALRSRPSLDTTSNLGRRIADNPVAAGVLAPWTVAASVFDTNEALNQAVEQAEGKKREEILPGVFASNIGRALLNAPALASPGGYNRPIRQYESVEGPLAGLPELATQVYQAAGETPLFVIPGPNATTLGGRAALGAARLGGMTALSDAPLDNPDETAEERARRIRDAALMGAITPIVEDLIPRRPFAAVDEAIERRAPGVAGLGVGERARTGAAMVGAGYAVPLVTGEQAPGFIDNARNAIIGAAIGPSGYRRGGGRELLEPRFEAPVASAEPERSPRPFGIGPRIDFPTPAPRETRPTLTRTLLPRFTKPTPRPTERPAGSDGVPTQPEPAGRPLPSESPDTARSDAELMAELRQLNTERWMNGDHALLEADPAVLPEAARARLPVAQANEARVRAIVAELDSRRSASRDHRDDRIAELEGQIADRDRELSTDALTGAFSQKQWLASIDGANRDPDTGVAVFDANNFGKVNKLRDQATGDEFLRDMGAAMRQAIDEVGIVQGQERIPGVKDGVYRMGIGDEFGIIGPKDLVERARARAEEIYGTRSVEGIDSATGFRRRADVSVTGVANGTREAAEARLQDLKNAKKGRPKLEEHAPVDQLHTDPARFQFKGGHGEAGVTGSLKGVTEWDPNLAGIVDVWRDPADNKVYVVNGHNRYAKAKELGVDTIAVRFLDAKSDRQARIQGALINIAEGNGSALDAATILREKNAPVDELRKRLPVSRETARDGLALTKLDDFVFNQVKQDVIPVKWGVEIANRIENPDLQQQALKTLAATAERRQVSDAMARELIDAVGAAPRVTETTATLFGDQTETRSLAAERADVAAHVRGQIESDRRAFSGAARNKERLEQGGNQIDEAQSKSIAGEASELLVLFDKEKNYSGPIADVLDDAARRIADGERAADVKRDAADRIRAALRTSLEGGVGRGPRGVRPETGGRGRETGTSELFGDGDDLPLTGGRGPDDGTQGSPTRELGQEAPAAGSVGRIPVAPIEGGKARRVREIWQSLEQKLGRVRVGKTGRGVGGYYDPSSAATIVKSPGDLDTLAHEASHRLDDMFGIAKDWKDRSTSPFDDELIPRFSQYGSRPPASASPEAARTYERAEGVAEFVRAYAVNPAEARRAAPRFAAYFDRKVPAEARRAIEELGRDMRELAGASPEDQALANFNLSAGEVPGLAERVREQLAAPEGLRAKLGQLFDRSIAPRLFDDLHSAVELGQRRALRLAGRAEATLRPRENFERLARIFKGVDAKLQSILEDGMINAKGERVTDTGVLDYLHEPFDRSSAETLRRDRADAVAYGAAERVLERHRMLRAEAEERLGPVIDRAEDRARAEIEAAGRAADAAEARIRERYDRKIANVRGDIEGDYFERAAYLRGKESGVAKGRAMERRRAIEEMGEGADTSSARGAITRIERSAERRIINRDARARARTDVRTGLSATKLAAVRDRAIDRVRATEQRRVDRVNENLEAFRETARARMLQAADRQASRLAGIGVGLVSDVTQAKRIIERFGQNEEREKKAQDAMRRYREVADQALRYMVDKKRISEDAYTAIKEWNEHYLAFNRTFDEFEEMGAAYRRAGGKLGRARETIKKQQGGTGEIEDPYYSLITKIGEMVKEADRNEAMRAFVDLVDVKRGMYDDNRADFSAIARKAREGDENTIRVFREVERPGEDGKPTKVLEQQHWQITDPDVHKALTALEGGAPPEWVDALSRYARVIRSGITYAPGFVVRNFLRDPLQRFVVSNVDSNPFKQLQRFDAETKRQFAVSGGDQAGAYLYDRPSYDRVLSQKMRELAGGRGPVRTIVAMPGALARGWSNIAQAAERQGRLAEFDAAYKRAKKDGRDDYDASIFAGSEARGLLDYAVAGSAIRDLNRIIPFLNAGIQGVRRSGRAIVERPGATALKWGMAVVLPRVLAYLWNMGQGDEQLDEYRQLPAYQRDMFLNVKLGANTWLAIPQPFEMGTAGAGVERALDAAFTGKPAKALEGYWGDLFKSLLPVDPDSLIAGPLGPVLQAATNYDMFRDRAIVPTNEADLDLELREGTKRASRLGQLVQDAVGVDARKVDFLIRANFGGTGAMVADASDLGRDDKRGALEFAEGLTGVVRSSPGYAARDVQFVMQRARARDEIQAPAVKDFFDLLRTYQEAREPGERDRLAGELRSEATRLREAYESTGSFLTDGELAKRDANRAKREGKRDVEDERRRQKYGQ